MQSTYGITLYIQVGPDGHHHRGRGRRPGHDDGDDVEVYCIPLYYIFHLGQIVVDLIPHHSVSDLFETNRFLLS